MENTHFVDVSDEDEFIHLNRKKPSMKEMISEYKKQNNIEGDVDIFSALAWWKLKQGLKDDKSKNEKNLMER